MDLRILCAKCGAIVQSEGERSTRPRLSSFGECIRLASRYVTSLENQPRSLLHPPRPFILSLTAPYLSTPTSSQATALANHRCNLTQPSRNRSDPPSPRCPFILLHLFSNFVALSFLFTHSNKHCLRDDHLLSSNET